MPPRDVLPQVVRSDLSGVRGTGMIQRGYERHRGGWSLFLPTQPPLSYTCLHITTHTHVTDHTDQPRQQHSALHKGH